MSIVSGGTLLGTFLACVDGVGFPTPLTAAAVGAVSGDAAVHVLRAITPFAPSQLLPVAPLLPAGNTAD